MNFDQFLEHKRFYSASSSCLHEKAQILYNGRDYSVLSKIENTSQKKWMWQLSGSMLYYAGSDSPYLAI